MIKQKDLLLVSCLRNNAREKLTSMSRKTNLPVSTIFDRIRNYEGNIIKKHTALLNFDELGFSARAHLLLKINKKDKETITEFLMGHLNVNSLYKINNGYDYLVECVFKTIQDLEDFLELVDEKFSIKAKEVFYIISDLKKESFMSDPNTMGLVC